MKFSFLKFFFISLASLFAEFYFRFVKITSRITYYPKKGEFYAKIDQAGAVITAFWHGQHAVQFLQIRKQDQCSIMISLHADAEIAARAGQKLGFNVIRGSGAQRGDQIKKRRGVEALRLLLAKLKKGEQVCLSADIPKIARVAGDGIIALAQLSQCPILPVAVISSRRVDFKNWDASSFVLPFGHIQIHAGPLFYVPKDANKEECEKIRQALEIALDETYARAYAAVGHSDPGANRPDVMAARAAKAAKAQTKNR